MSGQIINLNDPSDNTKTKARWVLKTKITRYGFIARYSPKENPVHFM